MSVESEETKERRNNIYSTYQPTHVIVDLRESFEGLKKAQLKVF